MGVLFGSEVAYRVSTLVIYIKPSLPGIAQLSPSDQPAPPICGAFFSFAIAKGVKHARGAGYAPDVLASDADARPAIAMSAVAAKNILEQVQQSGRQGV